MIISTRFHFAFFLSFPIHKMSVSHEPESELWESDERAALVSFVCAVAMAHEHLENVAIRPWLSVRSKLFNHD